MLSSVSSSILSVGGTAPCPPFLLNGMADASFDRSAQLDSFAQVSAPVGANGGESESNASGDVGGLGGSGHGNGGKKDKGGRNKMDKSMLRVNQERFRSRFDELARIGATSNGGVHRPALSESHLIARQWFLAEAEKAGLVARVDGAGNHSAFLNCGPANGATILVGSHLDSVPYGGRFDGALGVVSALEAIQTIRESGLSLKFNLEAIDFTDEEGHFIDLFGSQALTGSLKKEHLKNQLKEPAFREALDRAHLTEESILAAKRVPSKLAGYLELHVEQGPRLHEQKTAVGIVTSIVGIRTYKAQFLGRADHAGTTPMNRRLDASLGASSFALAARQLAIDKYPGLVVTAGNMEFGPGASNVVPEKVTVTFEFRAGTGAELDKMEKSFLEQAAIEAGKYGLQVKAENTGFVAPATMNSQFQRAIANASTVLGLQYTSMTSGAGHDAQSMSRICPAGMIFIPSVDGSSHSPREFTEWHDCVNGANIMLQTLLGLDDDIG